MANLIDLLKGIKNKIGSNKVNVEPVQMAENGGLDLQSTMELAQRQPKTPFERLFGRNIEIDTDTTNPTTGEITTERVAKFQPGMLNDIASGARENYTTGFAASNLQDNVGTEGQNKGLAYRIGEGAGTLGRGLKRGLGATERGLKRVGGAVGRFADSPLGRAAIMAGIVGATGGSGLEALAYGGTAGLGNQVNRMKDRAYRDSLINTAQQSRMGQNDWVDLSPEQQRAELNNIANRINGYRGYIGDDIYGQMIQAQQLRDNAQYRNMLLQSNMQNQKALLDFKEQEAARQARQDERDYNLDAQRVGLQARGLALEEQKLNQLKPLGDSQVKDLKGTTDFINSLDNIYTRYSDEKYDNMFGLKGDIRRNNPFSRYDAEASLFKQDVEILRQRYAKLLEGGRLSDSDRAFYQKALFNPNVSRKDFLEAVRRMRATLEQDYENALNMYEKQGKDVSDFRMYSQPQRANNTGITKSGIKYEVIE